MDRADPKDVIVLDVPRPVGSEPSAQRFRVPDLIWHQQATNQWGFIALLNSMSVDPVRYEHLWLQRFDSAGKAIGDPLDIDRSVPDGLRARNWEGLAWFEPGRSVILIDDTSAVRRSGPPTAVVVGLPDAWSVGAVKHER